MNPDIQQLQMQVNELSKKLDLLNNSATIPVNIERALRERLNNPRIYTGIVAPATTPNHVGDIFINTVLAKVYVATSLSSSSGWSILN